MDFDQNYYKSICRVCLSCSKQENMVPLIDSEENSKLTCYGVAVTTFSNIVMNSDSLPYMMCQRCLRLLKQAITFKKTCENSDKTLMRLVQNVHDSADKTKEKIIQYVMFSNFFADSRSKDCQESEKIQNSLDKSKQSARECKKVIKNEDVFIERSLDDSDDCSSANNLDSFQHEQVMGNQKESKSGSDLGQEEIKEDALLAEMENILKLDRKMINSQLKRYPKKPKPKPSKQQSSIVIRMRKPIKQQCEICNKVLANFQTYRSHKRSHTGKRFICEQCGKSFATNDILQSHLARIHNCGRFFECKQCGYKAYRQWDLDEHERIHSGERPFTCEKCGMRFRRQYLWKKHMTYHEDKTVQCPKCPRKFHMRGEMHAHYNNVHERWYVYACHVCDLTYAKTGTVRKHLFDKHGIAKEKQGKVKRIVIGTMPIATA